MTAPKRRTISLLAALLAAFVPLVALTVGVVIWEGYRKSRQAAMDAGNQLFQSHQTEVALQQQALFEPLRFAVSTFAADPGFGGGESERYLRAFMSVLQRYPHVSGIHAGYDNGELFEVIATRGTNPKPGMPEKTAFVVHVITANATSPTDTWRFLDATGAELSRQTQAGMSYDPRNRAWYRSALASPNDIVETMPYVIDVIDEPGVSVAHAFAGARSGVIAADVPLAQLSAIVGGLAADENEQLFLFLGNGKLLAHADLAMLIGSGPYDANRPFQLPDAEALKNPVAQAMLGRFRAEGGFSASALEVNGVAYLATVIRLGIEGEVKSEQPVYLALALPESNFTETFNAIGRNAAAISLLFLLLSIPVIVFLARRFSKPMAALSLETERIAQLDLNQPISVSSRISEIARLGEALDRMKSALGQIAKFVPKALVQDLVRSGTRMEVGGERRALSVVFTDVKDFTTMAETLPAEALMAQMSEYFEAIVQKVLEHGGTVDKYVGDAVFAFWNAPLKQPDHETLACRAALAARAASNALNDRWKAQGKPEWYTRLAVHMGDAVVGNVGSADRLDYTAVGDTINMGSRLEGLNKVYGTQILASGAIVAKTSAHFLFRPIDMVVPKGAIHPVEIAELIGPREQLANPAISALCDSWAKVWAAYTSRDWKKAYSAVIDHVDLFPSDGPGDLFARRLSGFLSHPPPPDWDGATRYESK